MGRVEPKREKCENAETAIRKAIAAHKKLSGLNISVFPQGSYPARTNVRQDSDVDICVRLNSTFFTKYPEGKIDKDFGNVDGTITYPDFRTFVGEALVDYFPPGTVMAGNKAFDVHANSYRIDADVIAAFELRRYTGRFNPDGLHHFHSGVAFVPKGGTRIENWPKQSYENGVKKHADTARRFKKIVRILKRLRNKMQQEEIQAAQNVASFLIESLVWNVPDEFFGHDTYQEDIREVLAHTFNGTLTDQACAKWVEVNGMKWLFSQQPWTREQAHNFISAGWDYLGLT